MLLAPERVSLGQIMSDAMRVVAAGAKEKRLMVLAEVDPTMHVAADQRALKQIILNLLSNAVKFTPDSGRINICARRRSSVVTIGFKDTGIGIPKESLSKLARPFEQVESGLTRTHKGSGLGLAIARSLVELHGGDMRIRSEAGKGTLVVIRLPLEFTGAKRKEKRRAPKSPQNKRRERLQGASPSTRTKQLRTRASVSSR